MVDRGYKSDADYFDLVAKQAKKDEDRTQLVKLADAYRALARTEIPLPFGSTRAEFWRKRGEECRTLAETFQHPACREQLGRLAETYDFMAVAEEDSAKRVSRPGASRLAPGNTLP